MKNKSLLFLLLGFLLSSWFFYNRFIRERTPRLLPETLSTYQIIIYSTLAGLSLLVFCSILFRLYTKYFDIQPLEQPTSIFTPYINFLREIPSKLSALLTNSFREFHAFVVSPVPNYIRMHLRISNVLRTFDFPERLLLMVMFVFIPQIVVCLGFAIDVFYLHQWNAFYKLLICLGYPLIINTYIGIVRQIYDLNFVTLGNYLKIIVAGDETIITFFGTEKEIGLI
jgi:hypothetical protein